MAFGAITKSKNEIENHFALLCEEFCNYLAKHNIQLRPYENRNVGRFQSLSLVEKLKVLEQVKTVLDIFSETEASGEKIVNSPKLMWRAFSKLKLTPCSDVFDKMEDDDVIVVYSLDHRQIFRNVQYFDTVSATFEEISTMPWWEIHIYPEEVSAQFHTLPGAIEAGHIQQTIPFTLPAYPVIEGIGVDKIKSDITMKWMSPVRSGDQIVALMTCAKAVITG